MRFATETKSLSRAKKNEKKQNPIFRYSTLTQKKSPLHRKPPMTASAISAEERIEQLEQENRELKQTVGTLQLELRRVRSSFGTASSRAEASLQSLLQLLPVQNHTQQQQQSSNNNNNSGADSSCKPGAAGLLSRQRQLTEAAQEEIEYTRDKQEQRSSERQRMQDQLDRQARRISQQREELDLALQEQAERHNSDRAAAAALVVVVPTTSTSTGPSSAAAIAAVSAAAMMMRMESPPEKKDAPVCASSAPAASTAATTAAAMMMIPRPVPHKSGDAQTGVLVVPATAAASLMMGPESPSRCEKSPITNSGDNNNNNSSPMTSAVAAGSALALATDTPNLVRVLSQQREKREREREETMGTRLFAAHPSSPVLQGADDSISAVGGGVDTTPLQSLAQSLEIEIDSALKPLMAAAASVERRRGAGLSESNVKNSSRSTTTSTGNAAAVTAAAKSISGTSSGAIAKKSPPLALGLPVESQLLRTPVNQRVKKPVNMDSI